MLWVSPIGNSIIYTIQVTAPDSLMDWLSDQVTE